ncbi:hypothetical protein [Plantactinospora endophytica]|uniref:Uncharacterized protein n=1 Tax=Plantactinospora endophytica TaxID=673535 RepID=A0ABQ4DZT2_9ACTN|nr:hypothetical protein [Plantactinospora endophytica]GIG87954.1 hypothetical protein Pen02_28900 [Plantactinospora endophytica]
MQKQVRTLGLPWIALIGLALLAVPRVVLHDLDVIQEGDFVNLLLVFVPPVIWIMVALAARVPKPFLTLLVVGGLYGVFLALVHQLLWDRSGAADATLGGNLENELSPGTEELVIRVFATFSGLLTGLLVGAVAGLVAWGASRLVRGGTRG